MNEVVGWKWLIHENILPLIGVSSVPLPFSMVSAWMENGDVMSFTKATPDQNPFSLVGVTNLVCGVADPMRSSWMRPTAYNTYTNATLSTVTSKA